VQIVSRQDVQDTLTAKQAGEYSPIIEKMSSGEAIRIHCGEWKKRTPVPFYFLGKYNRGKKTVSVRKVGSYYFVIKL
jgi:hypothetical protein